MPNAAYADTWYGDTMVAASMYPQLKGEEKVEVCVVGGGLAGLTVAYELARAGKQVVLLEAERLACKASGRNGGFVLPGFAREHSDLIKFMKWRGGFQAARALWQLAEAGLAYVHAIASQIPAAQVTPGVLLVQRRDNRTGAAREAVLYRSLGTRADVWDEAAVRTILGSDAYFQAVFLPDAFHMHPLNYALGLADLLVKEGGLVFENSRAIACDYAGDIKRVRTSGGIVHAGIVILAQGVEPPLVKEARPMAAFRSFIGVTEPTQNPLPRKAAFDRRVVPLYHRVVGGNQLLLGSRQVCFWRSLLRGKMRRELGKDYRTLSNANFSHIWSGEMAYVHHRMPVIDQIGPDVWVLSGFGGHGLNTTAMAGKIVADAILAHSSAWTLFVPFRRGRGLGGGWPGRLIAYAAFAYYRIRDWFPG
jgi:gamma-glutamylputrescine oxidase